MACRGDVSVVFHVGIFLAGEWGIKKKKKGWGSPFLQVLEKSLRKKTDLFASAT